MELFNMDHYTVYMVDDWNSQLQEHEQKMALTDLESGKILYCPQLSFKLYPEEQPLFFPYYTGKKTKNISFNPNTDTLRGVQINQKHQLQLKIMLARFSQHAIRFMKTLFPHYANTLNIGRTSYRPAQKKNRKSLQ